MLCVSKLCSSIKGQNLSCVVKDHDFIRNLPVVDSFIPSRPDPGRREQIKFNFYLYISLRCLKGF